MRLIVGLGNPDVKYKMTRHNLGFMVVAALAEQYKLEFRKPASADALVAKASIGAQACLLALPMTYMNNSGRAVAPLAAKNGILPSDILAVYDDLALGFGNMRVRPSGSAGGHNGIKSLIEHLGSRDFPRLRLGIGQNPAGVDAADYVLNKFSPEEKKLLPDFINQALLCVHSWVNQGVEQAMNQFNNQRTTNEQV
jgi:peptidyl-tRNA hydrolase, PTH1 family